MKRLTIFSLFLFFIVSCGREYHLARTMKDVESYVHDMPDSALNVLATLDTSGVLSNKVDAYYTLLNSIARYRLYIDENDDSALVRASDYYRSHRDNSRLMKSLFLAGYIQFNKANYHQAILSLTEAESISDNQSDHFYGGLISRLLAQTCENTFNDIGRLRSAQKAYTQFLDGGYNEHARYALLSLAEAYTENDDFEQSEKTYLEVINQAREQTDSVLLSVAMLRYAEDLIVRDDKDPYKALTSIEFVRDSIGYPLPFYAYVDAGYAAALLSKGTQSKAYFDIAERLVSNEKERYILDYRKYGSFVSLGDTKEALDAVQGFLAYLQKNQIDLERTAGIDIQRDYYQEREKNEKLLHTLTKQRMFLIVSLLVLSVLLLVWGINRLVLRKRWLQWENERLNIEMKEMENSHSYALKRSLDAGMHFFNKLAEFKWINKPEKILPTFEKMLNDLAINDRTIQEMMSTLNETRGNLMNRLEEQVPTMKKDDLMIYCYLAHQLDHTTLCTILNRTPGALNAKIYRIREKINKSDAKDSEEFLAVISR